MRFTEENFDATCEACAEVLRLKYPADGVLSGFFRQHPQLGRQDRALVAETVYAVLRRRRLLEFILGGGAVRQLVLAAWAVLLGANIRELEAIARRGDMEKIADAKRLAHGELPLEVVCDLPDWLIAMLTLQYGETQLRALAAGLLQSAPLDLRVNIVKTSRDEARARLAADGVTVIDTPYSPYGLRVSGKPPINRHPLFVTGALEVQDEGSQLLCLLLGARRGEMVADFCAGAGGKSLAIGMLMRSTGRLNAFDVSEKRLAKMKPRLARSGLSNVHPRRIENEKDIRLQRLAGKLDRVLVDAPCSGLGTLRRNPDLKWRQTAEAVAQMQVKQQSILAGAAKLVRPGGRLVYATCSLLNEENRAVVEAFLAAHQQFSLRPAGEVLREERIPLAMGEYLELRPDLHGTDGFFAAVLERAA
ncbi:MAG: SAM-dependent methyltransferase [Betaproteobacteria bacterium RIFCSPLOWO2_02_FULL_62_17]|nr:MAG: SAM-dependent methyltransferase [Betaproteobacteria bacterium RIFCSPLOWO2_02_FULL_62_17]